MALRRNGMIKQVINAWKYIISALKFCWILLQFQISNDVLSSIFFILSIMKLSFIDSNSSFWLESISILKIDITIQNLQHNFPCINLYQSMCNNGHWKLSIWTRSIRNTEIIGRKHNWVGTVDCEITNKYYSLRPKKKWSWKFNWFDYWGNLMF